MKSNPKSNKYDLERIKIDLNLNTESKLIKIEHDQAMIAVVYKVLQKNKPDLILKICDKKIQYDNEVFFLKHFNKQIPCPTLINNVYYKDSGHGAVFMEYLPGTLLTPELITKELAYEIGKNLAVIHNNKTDGFGYLTGGYKLKNTPETHFTEKFKESIEECRGHLPEELISKINNYYYNNVSLLNNIDGPCMIHRDFRPSNIIIDDNKLAGIIDWSSGRASFAEDDFSSIEHGEWKDFNGNKNHFLDGYSSVKTIPDYKNILPLLKLNKAMAIVGFIVKRRSHDTTDTKPYRFNRKIIDTFFKDI